MYTDVNVRYQCVHFVDKKLNNNNNIMHTSYKAIYARMMASSRAAQAGKHRCDANSILPSILYLLSSNLSDMLFLLSFVQSTAKEVFLRGFWTVSECILKRMVGKVCQGARLIKCAHP
mgnify:CR=1 FL=1